MSKKWLYLPIEVITRELDAKLILTYYAIKHNYNVVLAKQHKIFNNLESLPKGIIFSKAYPKNKKGKLFEAKEAGHAVVELDEEGFFFTESSYLLHRTNEELYKLMDQVYCWGKYQKDTLDNAYPHSKEKFIITGHPRFDLLNKKFHSLYTDEIARIQKQYGDFILVNTRFRSYNHPQGFRPKHVGMKNLYEQFIQMIKELSEKYPNVNIVIRPHPRENFNSYQEELSGYKNVFIVHEGNIVKWILASLITIHNGCTTGIEAFLLNKPVISYLPVKYNELNHESLPDEVSIKVEKLDEIFTFINFNMSKESIKAIENKKIIQKRKRILSNYYGALDGNLAYENIIRLLDKINLKSDGSLQNLLLHAETLNNNNDQKDSTIRDKAINLESSMEMKEEEIKTFFEKLNKIEGRENKVIIRKFERNFFEIVPDKN
ncbi:surface carbohydrate biosynthesis protein [Metabacillus fastidiosus]|uniref:surface carbohydrate biosynthesis protein n=1 Tax=Metabacillus fastidiosus TaxID=1458 RepID=UPI003D285859